MTTGALADRIYDLTNSPAEQTLIGALLCNNRAFERVVGLIEPEDFSNALHGRIFAAVGRMIDRGEAANPVTLRVPFNEDSALQNAGGAKYLVQLAQFGALVTAIADYARVVADLARRRRLIDECQRCIEEASIVDIDTPATGVMESHEQRLFALAGQRQRGNGWATIGEAALQAVEETEAAYKRGGLLAGVATGLIDLDNMLGGLLDGDLIVLAGRPAMGKTALGVQIGSYAADHGSPAAVFELEQTGAQLAQREMAWRSGIATGRQRSGKVDPHEMQSLISSRDELRDLRLYIDDTPALSISEIRQRARRLKRQHGIKLAVVDHLQLVRVSGKPLDRRLEVGEITRTLKQVAKELQIPILLLSQLSRAVESRDPPRPTLSDLRESGDIEQDADRVIFIFREEYYIGRDQPQRRGDESDDKFSARHIAWEDRKSAALGKAELIIAKDRHGATNSINVHWDANRVRFGNTVRKF